MKYRGLRRYFIVYPSSHHNTFKIYHCEVIENAQYLHIMGQINYDIWITGDYSQGHLENHLHSWSRKTEI